MEPIYKSKKGYSGRIYEYYNCGKCKCLLANEKEDLPNYCSNCGEKVDGNKTLSIHDDRFSIS